MAGIDEHVQAISVAGETRFVVKADWWPQGKGKRPRLAVTTEEVDLDPDDFDDRNREEVNRARSSGKGRTIAVIDRSAGQLLAVIGLHLPATASHPLLVRGIAIRMAPDAHRASIAAARLALQFAQALSRAAHRGGFIDAEIDTEAQQSVADEIGWFETAPVVRRRRPGGKVTLRWRPPV